MVDLLKRKKTENAQTVSDENAAMLPDDKKSKSEIATKKTNLILFIIAIGMLFVFFIGFIISSDKEKSEMNIPENKGNQIDTLKTIEDIYQIPYIKVMPDSVKVENQAVDENLFLQLALSVTNNPIKITDISVSFDIENLSLDTNDCIMRNDIAANGSCMINLTWLPTKTENRSGFIVVKYNDMDGEKIKNEGKIIRIPLSLRSIVVKPVEEEKTIDFAAEFDEEDDSDVSEEEQPDENIKQSVEIKSSQKTIVPDNCKKYASKAYDFSGTFIGWVQGNQDVFSPNCSKIIGTQQDDGMILETGTGRVIGKGVVFDNKKSEEKRVELTVPLLEDIIQKTTGTEEPNYEAIRANRDKAKSPDNAPRKVIGNEDIYSFINVFYII